MSLDPRDADVATRVGRLIRLYEHEATPPAQPLANAILGETGYSSELLGHEVAIGYMENVLGLPREVVAWVMAKPMAVGAMHRLYGQMQGRLPSLGPNPEAAERERLRREAQDGACPTCGRLEDRRAVELIDSYARSLAEVSKRLVESEGRA